MNSLKPLRCFRIGEHRRRVETCREERATCYLNLRVIELIAFSGQAYDRSSV
jgi:hypothetical protein